MDKKIAPNCFRPLELGESRLLILRHGAHKDNVLTEQAIRQAMATGEALKESGLKIDNYIASPSPRAIRTCLEVQSGFGTMKYIATDGRLSDLAYDHASNTPPLKTHMAELGREWNEPNIAKTIFDSGDEYFWLGRKLAIEARDAFQHHANFKETTLITTHGVGRIEPGLILLGGNMLHIPERLIAMGQIVEVILDKSENVVEENWLEPVAVPAQ